MPLPNMGMDPRSLRDPANSAEICIRIEPAIDCDCLALGFLKWDPKESLPELPPHYHWIVLGTNPEAREWYAIGGELPSNIYESSHGGKTHD